MFKLDDETSWLVYADWLEDQDLDTRHIREHVQEVNLWHMEYPSSYGFVGDYGVDDVGSWGDWVGGYDDGFVATAWGHVGSCETYPQFF